MRQQSHRVATALLLASAALPLTPGFAQDAQPADATVQPTAPTTATPPATAPVDQPAAQPTQSGVQASEPVINTRASGREPISPEATDEAAATGAAATPPAARQRPARSTVRAAAPLRARPVAASPTAQPPAPVAAAPAPALAPAPAPVENIPAATVPAAPIAAPPTAAPAPEAADTAPPAEPRQGSALWAWLLAAALAVAGLLLFARRRRRVHEEDYVGDQEPVAAAPVAAAPIAAAPIVSAMPFAPAVPAAVAAAAAEGGRPWIELLMRPVRAGVGEDAARVEFELGVENKGSAAAHDVRISTWMLPAGAGSEMERMLIEHPAGVERTEATIAPGDAARIETAVALPRAGLVDAITPVVVADARYRLPDGSEGRTSASFAVGVPDGDDLIMFDVDNPSGMHEGVEARLHGEPQRN